MGAKLLQLCPILCNPGDCSPPGFCPWDSPGKNSRVGCHFILHGILLTQGLKPSLLHLLHWQAGSLPRVTPGKPSLDVNRKLICCFVWRVLFCIYRGILVVPIFRINILCMAFIRSTRMTVLLGISSCVSGSSIATCDCFTVSCGFCINPTRFSTLQHLKSKTQVPKLLQGYSNLMFK